MEKIENRLKKVVALGALAIAFIKRENMPEWKYIAGALVLGFIAYGLSISILILIRMTVVLMSIRSLTYMTMLTM